MEKRETLCMHGAYTEQDYIFSPSSLLSLYYLLLHRHTCEPPPFIYTAGAHIYNNYEWGHRVSIHTYHSPSRERDISSVPSFPYTFPLHSRPLLHMREEDYRHESFHLGYEHHFPEKHAIEVVEIYYQQRHVQHTIKHEYTATYKVYISPSPREQPASSLAAWCQHTFPLPLFQIKCLSVFHFISFRDEMDMREMRFLIFFQNELYTFSFSHKTLQAEKRKYIHRSIYTYMYLRVKGFT